MAKIAILGFGTVGSGVYEVLQRNAAGERVLAYFRSLRGNIEALNRELGGLQLGRAGAAAPAGDERAHRPQLQLVAGAENVRPGRHSDHRLLLPADVHG